MRELYDVIQTPVVTEKSAREMETQNIYTFIVDERANKIEIAKAVERLWEVRVKKVRTMRYAGKLKRVSMGRMTPNRNFGRSPSFKKAIVQLAEGDHIEFYEAG
ncbi:MAG: 50S ribosomal protein L23 [Gemmatimonadetes bacterium]|nr:50S ribosomal protein L23 [Gemmatimonadota bacterium]MBI70351.1 50S ribosomal protein L23 [Gemmatimonadota bacterium]MCH2452209.1 50S ribosomal protein L23 [Gemmatimonadota bacterium]|tara:strand:+ start:329 stop:640 length:312 start_codon:yes stop_codon:yes gene_type:complete